MGKSNAEKMEKMNGNQLFRIYFNNGGRMHESGFFTPEANIKNARKCIVALQILSRKYIGLVKKIHSQYLRGIINEKGEAKVS